MKYRLVCVGRNRSDPLLDAALDYSRRIEHYAKLQIIRIRDDSLIKERQEILSNLSPNAQVVVLDERGAQISTVELARRIASWQTGAHPETNFVIGGAQGLHADVINRADWLLALSRLTLPHRLAQVVLLEQIYRAHSLLRGEPYHRA